VTVADRATGEETLEGHAGRLANDDATGKIW
jgi:hypothetical protein